MTTENTEGPGAATSTRRRKGTVTTITKQDLVAEGEDRPDDGDFAPLFDRGDDENEAKRVVRIRVIRVEPAEGMLGYLEDPGASESVILERFGGSTFRLEGVNSQGRIAKVRTVKLAGDPIFVSAGEEEKWRRAKGLPPRWQKQGEELSAKELLSMMDERESKRRAEEREREEAKRREDRESAEQRRKEEREWQAQREREQREWDDRRRRDDDERERKKRQEDAEREERRRKDDIEREERRQKQVAESAAQSQTHMQMMLTMVQQQANQTVGIMKTVLESKSGDASGSAPAEMLIKGVQLALQLKEAAGGDGEEDLLTTVIKGLPQMLSAAGGAVGKAIREVKGPANAPQTSASGGLMLPPGKVSDKFNAIITRVAQAGGDPEAVLDTVADRLLTSASPPQGQVTQAPKASPAVMDPGPSKQSTTAPQAEASPAPAAEPPTKSNVTRLKFKKQ